MTTPYDDDATRRSPAEGSPPQPQYGQQQPYGFPPPPGQPAGGGQLPPGAEFLSGGDVTPRQPGPRNKAKILAIAAAVTAVVLGAASVGAYAASRLSGGGSRPSEALPASAIAYNELDVDPGAGQKIGAIRFLRKFPELREKFAEDKDPRRSMWEIITGDGGDLAKLDYARDVEPWLGERVGVALLPPAPGEKFDGDKHVVVALQVRDKDKAREGIRKLNAADDGADAGEGDSDAFVAFSGDYAVLAASQATADRAVADAERSSLADQERFSSDVAGLGDRGVYTGWFDMDAVGKLADAETAGDPAAGGALGSLRKSLTGRVGYTVRFSGDDLEMVADGHGLADTAMFQGDESVESLGKLPASTVGAVGLAHGDAVVRAAWKRAMNFAEGVGGTFGVGPDGGVDQAVRDFEAQTGLRVPDDIGVLLGSDFAFGVDAAGLPDSPKVGLRVRTDGPRAEEVLDKVLKTTGGSEAEQAVIRRTPEGYVAASDAAHADTLARDGELGSQGGFKAALPDVDRADVAVYVDVKRVVAAVGNTERLGSRRETVEALDAIGLTMTSDGEGDARLRLKVITK